MENKLDSFLNLLKKASESRDIDELSSIEDELQKVSITLKNELDKEKLELNNEDFLAKLKSLEDAIKILDKNNNLNKETFTEFKNFIDNRKFK